MLTIRLQRTGKNKRPSYRIIVSENARDTQAHSVEILGFYNPVEQPKKLELKVDRIKHWISHGAQMSDTVHNLLVKEGVVSDKKRRSVSLTKKRREKIAAKKEAEKSVETPAEVSAEATTTE